MVYSAWDTAVKLTWSCPRWTRTFLLQKVLACDMTSARTDILGRYSKFCKGLRTSVCQEVRVLFNLVSTDLQCTTAKNMKLVRDTAGLDLWTAWPKQLKQAIQKKHTVDVPNQEEWKVRYLTSLLGQLQVAKQLVQDEKTNYIQGLIDSLVL